jgi:hypothetical protein
MILSFVGLNRFPATRVVPATPAERFTRNTNELFSTFRKRCSSHSDQLAADLSKLAKSPHELRQRELRASMQLGSNVGKKACVPSPFRFRIRSADFVVCVDLIC